VPVIAEPVLTAAVDSNDLGQMLVEPVNRDAVWY
jgi:hypothetical protein